MQQFELNIWHPQKLHKRNYCYVHAYNELGKAW